MEGYEEVVGRVEVPTQRFNLDWVPPAEFARVYHRVNYLGRICDSKLNSHDLPGPEPRTADA